MDKRKNKKGKQKKSKTKSKQNDNRNSGSNRRTSKTRDYDSNTDSDSGDNKIAAKWECTSCTFHNRIIRHRCEMCHTNKTSKCRIITDNEANNKSENKTHSV